MEKELDTILATMQVTKSNVKGKALDGDRARIRGPAQNVR